MTPSPPWLRDRSSPHWLSTREVARIYRRTERHIRRWCSDGTLSEAGIPVYRDPGGRLWIRLDASIEDITASTL